MPLLINPFSRLLNRSQTHSRVISKSWKSGVPLRWARSEVMIVLARAMHHSLATVVSSLRIGSLRSELMALHALSHHFWILVSSAFSVGSEIPCSLIVERCSNWTASSSSSLLAKSSSWCALQNPLSNGISRQFLFLQKRCVFIEEIGSGLLDLDFGRGPLGSKLIGTL